MKSDDEIKKELKDAIPVHFHIGDTEPRLTHFEYHKLERLHAETLAHIQQLESKLNQAVEDIRMLGRTGEFICPVCAHYNHGEGTKGECVKCFTGDGFRWRGEKEEGNNDA